MHRKPAFSLVELLVVIAIIALLVSIVMPMFGRAKELTRRTTCAADLNTIGRGINQYVSQADNRSFPYIPAQGDWLQTKVGENRDEPFTKRVSRAVTANLALLVKGDFVSQDAFVCPSTDDTPDLTLEGEYLDFASAGNISYAFQSPYGSDGMRNRPFYGASPDSLIVMADGGPQVNDDGTLMASASVTDWGSKLSRSEREKGNSPNHVNGEGQNVLYANLATVKFRTRADAGFNGDNIYTAATPPGLRAKKGSYRTQGAASDKDSFLFP